jgi:hypothetical protein
MKSKFCIVFAGVPGSSKTPIATYLSWNLGLPILNNDALRSEIKEDFIDYNHDEYLRRRDERLKQLLASGKSFIYDASIDRTGPKLNSDFDQTDGYDMFIISLDLSSKLVHQLYGAKGYDDFNRNFEQWFQNHESFRENYDQIINLHIDDQSFPNRLELSLQSVKNWLELSGNQ